MSKHLLIATAFASFISISIAHSQKLEESAFIYNDGAEIPIEFSKSQEFVVDHKSSLGFEVYGPRGMKAKLSARGLKFRDLDKENFLNSKLAGNYPSYEELTRGLKSMHEKYPDLTDLISIGKTAEGRDLWFMQISKHAHDDVALPEVKYISSMHGDEITGRELMMDLIRDVLAAYGQDQQITKFVDNTRIFIMPSMNPDGSFHIQRWNGNNRDLNRNFPDFSTDDSENSMTGREPETQAVMKYQASRHFSLSANFHGGAEVVNYMWDTLPDDHPLTPLLKDISLSYANGVSYMHNSQDFAQGITNGFAWYEVNGGMQDWSYYWYNDLQFTIELSDVKYPDYGLMSQYYRDNKDSLLGFLYRVHQGAGFISDKKGVSGTVTVLQNMGAENDKKNLGTFPFTNSYFYKVLSPGKYSFVIEGPNTELKSADVEVAADQIFTGGNFVKINL